jgi:hypothetical protein
VGPRPGTAQLGGVRTRDDRADTIRPLPGGGAPKQQAVAHRRALKLGIGISAALHILVVVLYSVVMTQWIPRVTVVGVDSPVQPSSDMRIVRVVEIQLPELTAEAPEELPETEEISVEISDVGPAPVEISVDFEAPSPSRRAAEVLKVTSSDTRLWREAAPEAFALTDAERMELELAGRLEIWTDSVAVALEAEYALTDWTTTDSQGRKWGFTPGQIHLGGLTLPLPFYFGGNAWQRDEWDRRAWEDLDILNGANTQAVRSSWSDRAEAIRRRQDRNRNENDAAADSTGGSGG